MKKLDNLLLNGREVSPTAYIIYFLFLERKNLNKENTC
jgi:hypothetical protein